MRLISGIFSLISFALVIIGALNWLLVGLFRFDLVRMIFGKRSLVGRLVYDLVGIAGLAQLAKAISRMVMRKPSAATA